jgi:fatty acid desaturase
LPIEFPSINEANPMNIDRIVLAFAGSMVLLSVILAYYVSPWWLLLALFVGANLLQSAFTGFCPLAMILARFGVRPGNAFRG